MALGIEQCLSGIRATRCAAHLAGGPHGDDEVAVFSPSIGGTSDALAVALEGVYLKTAVSKGCRPIGESLPFTRADERLFIELG